MVLLGEGPLFGPLLEPSRPLYTRSVPLHLPYKHISDMDNSGLERDSEIPVFQGRAMDLGFESFALLKKPSGARLIGKPISEYDPF